MNFVLFTKREYENSFRQMKAAFNMLIKMVCELYKNNCKSIFRDRNNLFYFLSYLILPVTWWKSSMNIFAPGHCIIAQQAKPLKYDGI